ncbi:MAG: hypothetical protein ACK5ME_07060 [Parahaliea sp.]
MSVYFVVESRIVTGLFVFGRIHLAGERATVATAALGCSNKEGLSNIRMFIQRGQMLDALGEEVLRRAVIAQEKTDSPLLPLMRHYLDLLREQVRQQIEWEYLLNTQGYNWQFMNALLSKTRMSNPGHHHMHDVYEPIRKMAHKLATRHSSRQKIPPGPTGYSPHPAPRHCPQWHHVPHLLAAATPRQSTGTDGL